MGIDFMLDDKFKIYLIEMNTNPAITLGKIFYLLTNYSDIIFVLKNKIHKF